MITWLTWKPRIANLRWVALQLLATCNNKIPCSLCIYMYILSVRLENSKEVTWSTILTPPHPPNPLLSSLHSQPKASGLLYVSSQTILQIFLRSSPEFLALCLLLWQPSVSVLLSQSNQLSHPLCEVFHEWVETVLLHCEPVQLQFLSLPLQRKQRNRFLVFTASVW